MAIKRKFKAAVILFIAVAIAAYAYRSALFTVTESAKAQFSSFATTAFYNAVGEALDCDGGVCECVTDGEGNVVYVTTDTVKVNYLAKSIAKKTLEEYTDFASGGVKVKAGAFFGIKLLSGVGKEIKVGLITVENVFCEYKSKYETLGINQTRQQLFLSVNISYSIIMPNFKCDETAKIDYILYDALIVGKTPEFYFGGGR